MSRERPIIAQFEVSANESSARGVQIFEWRTDHIIFGLSIAAVVSCVLLFFHGFGTDATYILLTYNFLFASLTFPLRGELATKISLLLLGNAIGLLWNYALSFFFDVLASFFGESFRVSYLILGPFSNMMWIVAFYSTSLSFLADLEPERLGTRLDS